MKSNKCERLRCVASARTDKVVLSFLVSGGLVAVTVFAGGVLASTTVSADNDTVVDQINITVPVSCTLSGSGMASHTAEIANGTYEDDIGTTTLKAFCNDNEGFAIYATGYTGNEIGGTNSNKLVGTPASIGNIDTGTATSGNTSNWAMKLATDSTATYTITLDNGFGTYSSVPNTYTKVAHRDSGTDIGTNATGASLTTTYAAYMSSTQGAGTYSGQVIYTLLHPSGAEAPLSPQTTDPGYIGYYPNASTAVGSMSDTSGDPVQQLTTDQTTATLLAPNFSRDGYGFAGWSDAFDWSTNANANFYGPNQDITFTAGQYSGTNNGLSLYAVWVKSAGTFQSDASTVCNSLTAAPATGTPTMASVSALTDERDNQTYAIAKLADGNCWMIENLRLEAEDTRSAEDEALAEGYGKYSGSGTNYGDFIGLADAESANFSSSTTANSLYYSGAQSGSATENIGTSNYPGYRFPRYNHINTDSTSASPTRATSLTKSTDYSTTAVANIYGYGNYYTWHAAIANTNHNGTNNQSTEGTSLCPAGWHLPTGGSVTTTVNVTETPSTWREFYNLGYDIMGSNLTAYESNASSGYSFYGTNTANTNGDTATKAFRKFPNNFVYSGSFNTASAINRGTGGHYWSSTASDYVDSCYLGLASTHVYPGTNDYYKYYGRSIRCLASS